MTLFTLKTSRGLETLDIIMRRSTNKREMGYEGKMLGSIGI